MDWLLWLIWTVWMTGSLLSMANVLFYGHFRSQQDQRWLDPKLEVDQKKVCWIIALKGFDKQLTEPFFKSLITQSYADYRIIFTFESDQDEGYIWLRNHLGLTEKEAVWYPSISSGLESVSLVVAGPARDCGQKVHNQIAAFARLRQDDKIIAFADADITCPPETLSRLVVPINMGHFDVMTTFRWLIPGDSHPATLLGSVINASCATMGGHVFLNTVWGGMVAIERETFEELRVPDRFSRVLSDDLTLNSLVKRSGRTIGFVRSLIVPSPVQFTWRELFNFGSRQYFMVKFYSIKLYLSAYEVTGLYLAGFISSIIAITFFNNPLAWFPLGAVMLSDQIRAFCRRKIYQYQFRDQPETVRNLDQTILIEHLCTPIWMGMQFIFIVSVLFKNTITWAGIKYRVKAGGDTTVLARKS
ncbi:MAG: hypothetical protein CMO61_10150 [Verrucomicrobiales bacterium]|nr:hypothetical protein [Verrucomicrobiales bacterium]